METNIDPSEWRREVDRVEKLLTIPEYPEFLISNSNYSEFSSANINGLFQYLNQKIGEDLNTKIKFFSNYLQGCISNNLSFEILKSCSEKIQNELSLIKKFENLISSQDNLKDKIKYSNEAKTLLKNKKCIFSDLEQQVEKLEIILDELIERIASNKAKEDSLTNNDNSKTENKLKERIKELKVKIYFLMNLKMSIYSSDVYVKVILCLSCMILLNFFYLLLGGNKSN